MDEILEEVNKSMDKIKEQTDFDTYQSTLCFVRASSEEEIVEELLRLQDLVFRLMTGRYGPNLG